MPGLWPSWRTDGWMGWGGLPWLGGGVYGRFIGATSRARRGGGGGEERRKTKASSWMGQKRGGARVLRSRAPVTVTRASRKASSAWAGLGLAWAACCCRAVCATASERPLVDRPAADACQATADCSGSVPTRPLLVDGNYLLPSGKNLFLIYSSRQMFWYIKFKLMKKYFII
jgi:hypothetical protein